MPLCFSDRDKIDMIILFNEKNLCETLKEGNMSTLWIVIAIAVVCLLVSLFGICLLVVSHNSDDEMARMSKDT